MDTRLVKDLLSTRKSLKQKFRNLKKDIAKSQSTLEKSYKPITEPLKELITSLKPSNTTLKFKTEFKEEQEEEPFIDRKEYYKTTPYDISLSNEPFMESSNLRAGESFFDESIHQQTPSIPENENERRFQQYLENYASPIPRAFIEDMIRSDGKDFDDRFGIYFDADKESWAIGNSTLDFDGQDVLLGQEKFRYTGTPGLYELLFKKNPVGYRGTDLENYIDIIRRSGAHYKERDPAKGLSTSKSEKFIRIIKPQITTLHSLAKEKQIRKQAKASLSRIPEKTFQSPTTLVKKAQKPFSSSGREPISLRSKVTGKGLMKLNSKKIEYRHFDNYNEIVDRLRLLIASESAGNLNHNNEIESILEELREAKIIS